MIFKNGHGAGVKRLHRVTPEEHDAREQAIKDGRLLTTRHPSPEAQAEVLARIRARDNDAEVARAEALARRSLLREAGPGELERDLERVKAGLAISSAHPSEKDLEWARQTLLSRDRAREAEEADEAARRDGLSW